MYHTCVFAGLAIYGHSDHKTDITIEFTSKNGSRRCVTLVYLPDLPYMVTLIMKQTIKFMSKNGSRRCITLVCLPDLPYMITTIMK